MTWGRLDDKLHLNHKVAALFDGPCALEAMGVWVLTASLAADTLSDGRITTGQLRLRSFPQRAIDELVRVGLWHEIDGGYEFHDWCDYNPSADRVDEKKRLASERKERHRRKLSTSKTKSGLTDQQLDFLNQNDSVVQERVPSESVTPEERACRLWDRDRENSSLSSSEISEQQPSQVEPSNVVPLRPASSPPPAPPKYAYDDLKRDFSERRQRAGGKTFEPDRNDVHLFQRVLKWAREKHPADPRAAIQASLANYLASEWHGRKGGWALSTWAFDAEKWLNTAPDKPRRAGMAPASTREERDATNGTNPDWLSDLEAAQ